MWPFSRKKVQAKQNATAAPRRAAPSAGRPSTDGARRDDSLDISNPLNPLSPLNPIYYEPAPSYSPSCDSYSYSSDSSSPSYDSGSSSYDSGSSSCSSD